MVTSLFKYERIETTKPKALEVRKKAEKLITRAKEDNVHNRRVAAAYIYEEGVVAKLFNEIGPLFKERKGGYTRILKTGFRVGDAAEMCILELVEKTAEHEKKAEKQAEQKAAADEEAGNQIADLKAENEKLRQELREARKEQAEAETNAKENEQKALYASAKAAGVRKTMAGGKAGGGDK